MGVGGQARGVVACQRGDPAEICSSGATASPHPVTTQSPTPSHLLVVRHRAQPLQRVAAAARVCRRAAAEECCIGAAAVAAAAAGSSGGELRPAERSLRRRCCCAARGAVPHTVSSAAAQHPGWLAQAGCGLSLSGRRKSAGLSIDAELSETTADTLSFGDEADGMLSAPIESLRWHL